MLQPDKNFGTVCAVASLLHAQTAPSASTRPFLQVKPMLDGRALRARIGKLFIPSLKIDG